MKTDIFTSVEPYESGKTAQGVSDLIRPDTSHGQAYTGTVIMKNVVSLSEESHSPYFFQGSRHRLVIKSFPFIGAH